MHTWSRFSEIVSLTLHLDEFTVLLIWSLLWFGKCCWSSQSCLVHQDSLSDCLTFIFAIFSLYMFQMFVLTCKIYVVVCMVVASSICVASPCVWLKFHCLTFWPVHLLAWQIVSKWKQQQHDFSLSLVECNFFKHLDSAFMYCPFAFVLYT